mgnify:CR=1 FL=1|jgi:LPS export ABC transporter protein LptC
MNNITINGLKSISTKKNFFRIIILASFIFIISFFWKEFNSSSSNLKVNFNSSVSQPKLKIEGAKYNGVTSTGEKFSFLAEVITESSKDENWIEMINPHATIKGLKGNIYLTSKNGEFNIKKNHLSLSGNVTIIDEESELKFETDFLKSNLKDGKYISPNVIKATLSKGKIISEGMIFFKNDKKLFFSGNTVLYLK